MNKEQIIEAIESMTVLELSELVKALEEKFGVSAAAPVAVAAAPAAGRGGGCVPAAPQAAPVHHLRRPSGAPAGGRGPQHPGPPGLPSGRERLDGLQRRPTHRPYRHRCLLPPGGDRLAEGKRCRN